MTEKHAPQIVGNVGLFYACFRLSQLGWNAMPTSRNAKGIDVICFNMTADRVLSFQVKSLSKRSPVPLGTNLDRKMGDFWIIVVNTASAAPECYVLTPQEVCALAHRGEKNGVVSYWLQPKQYNTSAFRDQWVRIGLCC